MMQDILEIAEKNPQYRHLLFSRGFLFTDAAVDATAFPFYGTWKEIGVCNYQLLVHPELNCYISATSDITAVLIGHVYNPFDGLYNEKEILEKYLEAQDRLSYYNEWTGLFTLIVISDDRVEVFGDCAGMQSNWYACINAHFYLSSHAQLIGDICRLPQTDYAKKMQHYRFWKMYGVFFPGDISQFEDVFRLVPNHILTLSCAEHTCKLTRFYPFRDLEKVTSEEEYDRVISKIAEILHETMRLISEKWDYPSISMTGGMDSKTTLACANGLYDQFRYYSYISMYGDKPDADAAAKIADAIGVEHKTYVISENNEDFADLPIIRSILEHNLGDIGSVNDNDVRKRLYFLNTGAVSLEVKSWVSEIGRANYYKKFGFRKMPHRLSARQMTTMYKFFSYNRLSAHKTDKIFREYIQKTAFDAIYNFDASDMYLWEMRYGGWGGLKITAEHRISYDITIPYNNRLLMELFLRLPLEKRIADIPHYDVIRKMNQMIDRLGITVTNYNETERRKHCERIYYLVNTHLPF